MAAATASEKLEALEAALPESMEALCTLIRDHADLATPGAVFATRQLLRLASAQDLSDAAAAKAGGALADQLMRQGPLKDAATRGVTADWEAALVAFASAALGAAAPPTVLAAALAVVEAAPEDDAAWLHALALTAALLQGAASLRAAGGTALVRDGLLRDLVLPAVQHSSCAVRAAGMRSLGLVCVLDSQLDAAYVALLRHAAAGDARLVRCQATRALCDLALLHGLPALDGCLPPAALPAAGPSAATAPLLAALQQCLVEPAQGLAAPAQGAGGDADDVEEEPRTVAAEGSPSCCSSPAPARQVQRRPAWTRRWRSWWCCTRQLMSMRTPGWRSASPSSSPCSPPPARSTSSWSRRPRCRRFAWAPSGWGRSACQPLGPPSSAWWPSRWRLPGVRRPRRRSQTPA